MAKDNETVHPVETSPAIGEDEKATKLVMEILAGRIIDIGPELDFTSELGFTYPIAEQTLGVKDKELLSILESLVDKGILKRDFFDRLLRCPQCGSINLRPTTHCPKCGSGNIARGRVLEHFVCGYIGLEDEFVTEGRYICPRCRTELKTIDSDYKSQGLLRKCRDCGDIFTLPLIKWRCLQCSSLTAEDKVTEVNIYSYRLNEAKRSWLDFELNPKLKLIGFLRGHGYEVTENATKMGRSGAEHSLDILAARDDGIVTHHIAIGIEVGEEPIGLNRLFSFDNKVYDIGIHEKVLVVAPGLTKEAEAFASRQRIKVLEARDLEAVLASAAPQPSVEIKKEPFEFKSKSQLIEYLKQRGYEIKENTAVKGRSGAEYNIDILATQDDGIITHHIAIGIEVSEEPIELNKLFDFDDKAYDIGIQDKVFITVPGLSREARQFAERQRTKVFEVKELEPAD